MRIAVILSTYNAPHRLAPTLTGYAAQRGAEFEIIVADDGSTDATREVIEQAAHTYGIVIRRVWQPDAGFRKCRILNQAAIATDADYVIFSDGDCVPRADFVATHAAHARPGRFLSGGYFKLTDETSKRLTPEVIFSGHATDPEWLLANGTPRSARLGKLRARGWHAKLMNAMTPTRPSWNGHNSSCWRNDLLEVNGHDERMAYWAQDREFGERLANAGVTGLQIRYSAICVHINHDRPYKTERSRELNKQIRAETKARRATWTEHGILKTTQRPDSFATRLESDVIVATFGGSLYRRSAA
ncbi:glycosyltransferase [Peristeroidobacter soli]|uniref:glycosyltransferase n=1 Tax=Peristeroidobacter soli TaxID=2497877 RepID=UPI00101D7202|nr:glycosyltransferase [Peristeroidobacter soli]